MGRLLGGLSTNGMGSGSGWVSVTSNRIGTSRITRCEFFRASFILLTLCSKTPKFCVFVANQVFFCFVLFFFHFSGYINQQIFRGKQGLTVVLVTVQL